MYMIDSNEMMTYENGRKFGHQEGYNDGLTENIRTFTLKQGEYVILFYDNKYMDFDCLNQTMQQLHEEMPLECNIIALPKGNTLENYDKDFLKRYIKLLQEVIDEME